MSNTATPKATRTRKPKEQKPVETPAVETPVEAPKAEIAVKPKPLTPAQERKAAEALAANVEKLQTLTAEAKAGIEGTIEAEGHAAEAFHRAAIALNAIRSEQLVEKVTGAGDKPLSFKEYVEQTFGVSRDLGDKYARAGQVLTRLQKELGDDIVKFPLPLNEGQARGLGALLNADPKGQKHLVSKGWKKAWGEARTEAEQKAEKTGFVPTIVVPAPRHVTTARRATLPVNGSTQASRTPTPASNLDGVAAKLRKIHADNFAAVEWGTFISIVAETAEVAHVAAKGVLRSIEAK